MLDIIPERLLPLNAQVDRIICHWTASPWGYDASPTDRAHYHFLITGGHRAEWIQGDRRIGQYAPHTWRLNTGSIGIACCAMGRGKHDGPVNKDQPGSYPLQEQQWDLMVLIVAQLCKFYELPVLERTVLQHGDVTRVYGPDYDQLGKWDCNFLPWAPDMGHMEVGHKFRYEVQQALDGPTGVTAIVDGVELAERGLIVDNKAYLPLRALAERLGLQVTEWRGDTKTAILETKLEPPEGL